MLDQPFKEFTLPAGEFSFCGRSLSSVKEPRPSLPLQGKLNMKPENSGLKLHFHFQPRQPSHDIVIFLCEPSDFG